MLNEKVVKLLNDQINKEFYSAYLYLHMANYYTSHGLIGFANWFNIQAQEEQEHALMFMNYLHDNGVEVKLNAIDAPNQVFDNFLAPLEAALKHEEFVTASINIIYGEAKKENDYRTLDFLNWFIREQAEEEKNASDNIAAYKLFATDGTGLFTLDSQLKTRTFVSQLNQE